MGGGHFIMDAVKMINALTIMERREVLKNESSDNNNIEIWKSIKSKLTDKQIEQVIELRGVNHREFNNTIQDISSIQDESIISCLREIVGTSRWFEVFQEVMNAEVKAPQWNIHWEISMVIMNFVNWGMNRIKESVKNLKTLSLDTDVYSELERYLYQTLFAMASKAFVYEFNKEKNSRKHESYTIKKFVIERLENKEQLEAFYYEYPVLARRLSIKVDLVTKNIIDMLANLDREYAAICNAYMIDTSKIRHIKCGSGDTHRQGKTVCIISIGEKKIVYKPYGDELGIKFNEFLRAYNKYTEYLPFMVMNNLYYKTFTIYEYIENKECRESYQVNSFYNRIGQLLFILHLLGANDMHCENLIACEEYPVIVDYETIIGNYNYNKKTSNAFDEYVKEFSNSVVNIGFLPITIKGLQMGGLNNQGGTQSIEHEAIENKDDENIVFKKQKFMLSSNKNLPIFQGEAQDYKNYVSDIINGFERGYHIFLKHKKELKEALSIFQDTNARVVLQATQNYADICDFTSHPKYLYDMLDMEKLLENVINPFHGITEALLYEIKDLHNGDIPIFFVNSSGKDLISSEGYSCPNFFNSTIYEDICSKMNNLEHIYQKQQKLLFYYLECGSSVNHSFWRKEKWNGELENSEKLAKELRLELEKRISDRILLGKDKETLTWLTMNDNSLNCVFSDVYDGFGGLAEYFIQLKKNKQDSILLNQYEEIMKKMLLGKETFWGDESLGLCRNAGSELYILNEYYEEEKSVEIEEKISALLNYMGKKTEQEKEGMPILEEGRLIEILSKTYQLLDNYDALKLMETIGKNILMQLKQCGYISLLEGDLFHIGHVLQALAILHETFEEEIYKEELLSIFQMFVKKGVWEGDTYILLGKRFPISDGLLLHMVGYLKNVPYISQEEVDKLQKEIRSRFAICKFKNDTLHNGFCAGIDFCNTFQDKENMQVFLDKMLKRFQLYQELKVEDAPLYANLSRERGYIGVLNTFCKVYAKK